MQKFVRKQLNIFEEQEVFLLSLGGTISEHIRRAIDEYIEKKKDTNVSTSLSKGVSNG